MDIDDVTVVLLPGLNGTKGLFDPLIDASMGECKIHVISYPTHSPKSYCKLSEYVEEKLTSLSGRYILVGESFSGPISIFLTSKT